MPQDALTYSFIVDELNRILSGSKIDKIVMPFKDEIILSFRHRGKNFFLLISLGQYARMHLIKENKSVSPPSPFAFCMHLRKNIGGGIIESVTQVPFERIINVNILFRNELGVQEDKTLVLEIMGRYSNAIVVNKATGKISDCAKHIMLDDSVKRAIMPGLIYALPDNKSPDINKEWFLSEDILLDERFRFDNDLAQNLNIKGLAPISKRELIYNANLNNESCLNDSDRMIIFDAYKALYNDSIKPCTLASDFFIRPYNSIKGEYVFFDSLNEAMDNFFSAKDLGDRLKSKSSKYTTLIKNLLKRSTKKLSDFENTLALSKNLEEDRIFGELITSNIYKLKQGDKELVTLNYYDNKTVSIPLDPQLNPAKNAQKYYKKYSKKRRALTTTHDLIIKTQQEIELYTALKDDLGGITSLDELTEIIESMANLKLVNLLKRAKKPTISPVFSQEIDGFVIKIGKNNIQNDRLVRQSKKDDLWFHVKNFSGSHIIIEVNNKEIPDKIIQHAAKLAAQHSKAKHASKAEVDYTYIKHVHKQAGAPLGKVTYTHQKTIVVSLD